MPQKAKVEHRGFNLGDADRFVEFEDQGIDVHMRNAARDLLYYQNGKGEPSAVIWKVAGRYSDRYRRAEEEVARTQADEEANPFDRKTVKRSEVERAARCVISWEGVFDESGDPLECSVSNVRTILLKYDWVLPQVVAGMVDHAGFQKTASGG